MALCTLISEINAIYRSYAISLSVCLSACAFFNFDILQPIHFKLGTQVTQVKFTIASDFQLPESNPLGAGWGQMSHVVLRAIFIT